MTKARTLAAALALSLAGMSAAQACTGYVTLDNQTHFDMKLHDFYTQDKNGKWRMNLSWFTGLELKAYSRVSVPLNTTRGPNRAFAVKVTGHTGDRESSPAKCSEGWTIVLD